MAEKSEQRQYTCGQYREEMILLSLNQRLGSASVSDEEKIAIRAEIKRIEKEMGMD